MMSYVRNRHKRVEQQVVSAADCVVTTSPSLSAYFKSYNSSVVSIFNGYEKPLEGNLQQDFTMTYAGALKSNQHIEIVFSILKTLSSRDQFFAKQLRFRLYGAFDNINPPAELKDQVIPYGYQPKDEIDRILPQSHILLLLGNDQADSQLVIHGKLYAYMAARRPVLALVNKHGDMSKLIKEYKLRRGLFIHRNRWSHSLDRKPIWRLQSGNCCTFGHAWSKLFERKTSRRLTFATQSIAKLMGIVAKQTSLNVLIIGIAFCDWGFEHTGFLSTFLNGWRIWVGCFSYWQHQIYWCHLLDLGFIKPSFDSTLSDYNTKEEAAAFYVFCHSFASFYSTCCWGNRGGVLPFNFSCPCPFKTQSLQVTLGLFLWLLLQRPILRCFTLGHVYSYSLLLEMP